MSTEKNTNSEKNLWKRIQQQHEPSPLAGLGNYGGSPSVTVRFVPEPKVIGEHSLAALDMARNFDALPSLDQDRLQDFVQSAWKRQEGTDEEQQEARRRYERLDWLTYVVGLRHEGWTLEDLCRHMGETEEEAQSLAGITEAVEAWLQSEPQRRELSKQKRDEAKRDEAESEPAEEPHAEAVQSAPAETPLRLHNGKPMTAGMIYAEDFLDMDESDSEWIARNIDDGFFQVCPRCHFLHLPTMAYWQGIPDSQPQAVDACDVCALVSCAATLPWSFSSLSTALAEAPAQLAAHRQARAQHLFDMWMEASLAADTWVLAAMGAAVSGLTELVQTPISTK